MASFSNVVRTQSLPQEGISSARAAGESRSDDVGQIDEKIKGLLLCNLFEFRGQMLGSWCMLAGLPSDSLGRFRIAARHEFSASKQVSFHSVSDAMQAKNRMNAAGCLVKSFSFEAVLPHKTFCTEN